MAAAGEKNGDFYSVLGLNKECSDAELRNAYKKLALVRIQRFNESGLYYFLFYFFFFLLILSRTFGFVKFFFNFSDRISRFIFEVFRWKKCNFLFFGTTSLILLQNWNFVFDFENSLSLLLIWSCRCWFPDKRDGIPIVARRLENRSLSTKRKKNSRKSKKLIPVWCSLISFSLY